MIAMLIVFVMFSGTACTSEIADDLLSAVIEEMEASQTTTVPEDAQQSDAGPEDAHQSDAGSEDVQQSDAGSEDVQQSDGGPEDTQQSDAGSEDVQQSNADEEIPQQSESVPEAPQQSDNIPDLEALHDPAIFTRTALEHIFVGSVNSRGAASGYHSEAYPEALGEVIGGTRSKPDADGVYEAKVRVDGIDKAGNRGYSTFFPVDMTVEQVVQAIREAYETRNPVTGNTWRGEGGDLSILMYLDDKDRIISAFPEYGG